MKLEIEVDEKMAHVLEVLRGTDQWGETHADVLTRLAGQRVWQLCGDALDTTRVGSEAAPKAVNQITKPK